MMIFRAVTQACLEKKILVIMDGKCVDKVVTIDAQNSAYYLF